MKILRLQFKNIHSLKGEHALDFTIPPLSVSGLFAITGPTGAGKSTILDVITLALFSRIPRFDSKITNTEIEKIGSVMTHFAEDAYAEVEYQSNGKIYRSTWKIAKTRTGNLKPYEMTLATLPDGTYMDLKNSDVPAANERIIGLNYEQFIRSILLSQGEFAKFLKSDEKERAKLLEDITGSQIYRAIGKAAYDKAKEKREEIQVLKQQISAIPTLSEDEVKEKNATILTNIKRMGSIKKTLDEKVHLLNLSQKRSQILHRLEQLNVERKAIDIKKEAFHPQEIKLLKHQSIDIYRSELTLQFSEEKRLKESQNELSALQEKIKRHEVRLQEALDKMSAFVGVELNDTNFMSETKKFEQHITSLDKSLENLRENGAKIRNKLTVVLDNSNHIHAKTIKNIKSLAEQLTYAESECLTLQNRITTYTDHELKTNIDKYQELLLVLQQKNNDALSREAALHELANISNDINKSADLQKEYVQASKQLSSDIEILEKEIGVLTKKKETQLQFASLDEHRKYLKDGEPCALCGSTDHPYAHIQNLLHLGEAELEIFQKTEAFNIKKNKYNHFLKEISVAESKIELLTTQAHNRNTVVLDIEKKWSIGGDISLVSSLIAIEIEQSKATLKSYSEALESITSLKFLKEITEILQDLSIIATQYLEINKERNEMYSGKNINADADLWLNSYIAERETGKEWKFSVLNLTKNIESLERSIDVRNSKILPKLEALGYNNISEAIQDILDDGQLQTILSTKESLRQSEIENKTSIQNLENELVQIIIRPEDDIQAAQLQDIIGTLNKEKDDLIHQNGALENELTTDEQYKIHILQSLALLKTKEIDASKWFVLERLIGDSTGTKFAKYAQNLSLKHLITLANKRLAKLTDRYLLAYADIESDLTVSDLYQGSITRSVKTLSGGESFIVSLALALSLADMASKNVKLECLFIDEGFGTLDAETLETALETLEKLQSETSRTIGVISHVDSLKERISTQVRIHKNNLGHSLIEVV